jgi:cell division initiation protein
MRISPQDIRQQQFTIKLFRGFDPQEVDAFLEDVADDYETLLKECQLLKEQLAAQEERQRGVAELEKALQDTLLTAQRLADELKAAARREAEETRSAARHESELIVRGPSCAARRPPRPPAATRPGSGPTSRPSSGCAGSSRRTWPPRSIATGGC